MICPAVIENVRAAQRWMGPARAALRAVLFVGELPDADAVGGEAEEEWNHYHHRQRRNALRSLRPWPDIGKVYYPIQPELFAPEEMEEVGAA
ncbi:MAG: hypothetical protein IPM02_25835 [Betaproteobacteria bacterium]|nr:hypothetical protein [Betaproteobacteria bacterium]